MKCFISTFRFNLTTNKKIIEKNILIKHRKEKKRKTWNLFSKTEQNTILEKRRHNILVKQNRKEEEEEEE